MLVLVRRKGETITIGHDASISITIINIKGRQVSVGIKAPKNVPVHREEIHKKLKTNLKKEK